MTLKEGVLSTIQKIRGVESVFLVEKVGLPTEFLGDQNATEVSAMTASLWGLGEYYITKFGEGDLNHISIESNEHKIITFSCNNKILVVSGKKNMSLGKLENEIKNGSLEKK